MNKIVVSSIVALLSLSCTLTTPMINTSQDFSDLEKEYKSFSTKALSNAYVKRMFGKYLTESPNPTQVIRQLEFARYLKGKSDTSYFDSLKTIIANENSIYTKITAFTKVSQKMTTESGTFGTFVQSISPLPGVPVATSATAITATSFTANWNAVSDATSYKIVIDGVETILGNVTTYTKSGLTGGTTHTYYIKAVNGGGTGSSSNTINVATNLPIPGSLTTTAITATGFTANWGAVSGATSYDVIVDSDSPVNISSGNLYNATGLTTEVVHTWKVRANNLSVSGIYSSVQSIITSFQRSVSTFAGSTQGNFNGTGTSAQFNKPSGVDVDSSGNVYVADKYNNVIKKITSSGVVSTLAGSTQGYFDGASTSAQFSRPMAVAVDSSGNVYVADTGNSKIRKITPAGIVSTLTGINFSSPQGVAVDSTGNVYIADTVNHMIKKITPGGVASIIGGNGNFGYGGDGGQATNAYFGTPFGLAVDSNNNVYIADSQNSRIRKITPAGIVSTFAGNGTAGTVNGPATSAQFSVPMDVSVDSSNNVYVVEWNTHMIRKITTAGIVFTIAGNGNGGFLDGLGTFAKFSLPNAITVDSSGGIYVADTYNDKIRKIQ